jgi:hypothetical protein
MRLLASLSLIAAVLFWTHPFYASRLAGSSSVGRTGAPGAPVLVLAPTQTGALPQ